MSDMDERESLFEALASVDRFHDFDSGDIPSRVEDVDAILAAGFRRRAQDANTHTHGLDDIACPERLVGECVIEREVAHAVAIERERVAALAEQRGLHVIRAGRGRPMVTWRDCEIRGRELTDLAEAIRNGAHDGGRDDA